ncbi:MAG: MFS transporter [Acidobacteria bacterium]|nr:MFS transporter [Acidobacteriota bacterium]
MNWSFIISASPRERRALLASMLGWMLDGMDVTLYAMVMSELMRSLNLTTSQAGLLASVTLVSSALGGVLFGILADRLGRRTAMIMSILAYSLFTAACGLSRGIVDLAIFRALLGLGMGGEWATGAALVAETWRAEHRAKAMGLMQSGFAVGYALAALIAAIVLPRWGWRAVFLVGIFPALLTLWVRRGVEESPVWLARKSTEVSHATGAQTISRSFLSMLVVTTLMNAAALFGWWGLFTWIPSFLALPAEQGGRGLTLATSSTWIMVMQAGMWLGYVSFGFFSDLLGRRRIYVAYLLLAALLVPFYARARGEALFLLGPLLAFFGTGHFTGFGIIAAELFPTEVRASAMGLAYNFGRAFSAGAPWMLGTLAGRAGIDSSFWVCGVAYLVATLLALALPETRGRTLA